MIRSWKFDFLQLIFKSVTFYLRTFFFTKRMSWKAQTPNTSTFIFLVQYQEVEEQQSTFNSRNSIIISTYHNSMRKNSTKEKRISKIFSSNISNEWKSLELIKKHGGDSGVTQSGFKSRVLRVHWVKSKIHPLTACRRYRSGLVNLCL